MCLYTLKGRKKPKIAKEAFYTWKLVEKGNGRGEYRSRVQNFLYSPGFHYYETNFKKRAIQSFTPSKCYVEGNALHSYKTEKLIENLIGRYVLQGRSVWLLCYVPAGAKYYEGKRDIASSELVVVKAITPRNRKAVLALL